MTAPAVVRSGPNFVRQSDQSIVYLRGCCYSVPKTDTSLLYTYLPSEFPGSNLVKISMQWDSIEPNRPTGGNPALGPGNGEYRAALDPSSPSYASDLLEMEAVLEWCDANGYYAIISMQGTGAGVYFNSSQTGYPTWLFDDTQWSGGQVAPLPHDRANYGGHYPTSAASDAEGAKWISAAAGDPHYAVAGGKSWAGDWDVWWGYMKACVAAVHNQAATHPSYLGIKLFNEPQSGGLKLTAMQANLALMGVTGVTADYTTSDKGLAALQAMLRRQQEAYAYYRGLDSQRFVMVMGSGGNSFLGSADWSRLWTPNGAGGGSPVCPSDHPYVLEAHWYSNGAVAPQDDLGNPSPPYPFDNGEGSSFASDYAPVLVGGVPVDVNAMAEAFADVAEQMNVPLMIGEWGKHNSNAGAAQYVTDMGVAYRANRTNYAYFSLAGGASTSPLSVSGSPPVATLTTVGVPLAAMLAVPYPSPVVSMEPYAVIGDFAGCTAEVGDLAGCTAEVEI